MEHFEITHLGSFFQDIIRQFPVQYRFSNFLITHLLAERPSFVRAIDVGGYYARILNELIEVFSGRIMGVVEDTENGYQRYLELDHLPCPIFSVARSKLKVPEDYLAGPSIAFSVEMLVRGRGDVLAGMEACVIGYRVN